MEVLVPMRALITGIGGQTGSYMADLLLEKGYQVHGIIRRSSNFNTERLDPINRFVLYQGDVTDAARMAELIYKIQPEVLYHFAAQSHVKSGFDQPLYTQDSIVDGTLNILEAIRIFSPKTRLYYAGSSEMFGNSYPDYKPVSPYGCAKYYGHNLCTLYREAYGLWICAGTLFNHESPRRGLTFVSRKITYGLGRILSGQQDTITLGNLSAGRDWGYAPEFCQGIYLAMQEDAPRDVELSTGETHSIEEFAAAAFSVFGLDWKKYVRVSDKYKRPFELNTLKGDPERYAWLGWRPQVKFRELVRIMAEADAPETAKLSASLDKRGLRVYK